MSYPRYSIHRWSQGGYAICDCAQMNCAVTAYVEPADRAYRYDAPCTQEGHSRPVEVPLEEAEAGTSAHLIAAAPELLRIVKTLCEYADVGRLVCEGANVDYAVLDEAIGAARDAIAKIEED
jgi:hypothetical protein